MDSARNNNTHTRITPIVAVDTPIYFYRTCIATMMKATGLKRGSRKKQDVVSTTISEEEQQQHRQVMPSQKQHQQQQPHQPEQSMNHTMSSSISRKQRVPNDEVTTLTTKNYRLAKELVRVQNPVWVFVFPNGRNSVLCSVLHFIVLHTKVSFFTILICCCFPFSLRTYVNAYIYTYM